MIAATLLLVDDDDVYRQRLSRSFVERGLNVVEASSVEDAAAVLAGGARPTYAVLDVRMPGASGVDALKLLRAESPSTRVVMLTGWGSIANTVEALRLGAVDYLTKPATADEILAALQGRPPSNGPTKPPTLDRVEWEHIQRVLTAHDGNVSQTARDLGLQRRSLQRKLAKRPSS